MSVSETLAVSPGDRGLDAAPSPFHAGETAVQERLGVRERIEPWARRVVRPFLPEEHRRFYEAQPFLVAAARDAAGRPWVTLLTGAPGFVATPDDRTLQIDVAALPAGDPLSAALTAGAELGLLGIEFESRRRNRVNGTVTAVGEGGIEVQVGQSFGNCPQHIVPRRWERVSPTGAAEVYLGQRLDQAAKAAIEAAETFFIASGHRGDGSQPSDGMDASHRGGPRGFVVVEDERTIVFPDYAGNNHFNTVGNLVIEPAVGITFVDFEAGDLLQLTGQAEIDWHPDVSWQGAERLIRVRIDEVVRQQGALPLRWARAPEAVRSLQLVHRREESADVTSFFFQAADGLPLPPFAAGQHLPLTLQLSGQREAVTRTYTLSAPANGHYYRISVKREPEGLVSRLLHDELSVGDVVRAEPPAGAFVLEAGTRPVVLVSAGVGITPMLTMLAQLARAEEQREVLFAHGARDGDHLPLAEEFRALVAGNTRFRSLVALSRPGADDLAGIDYDLAGRLTVDAIVERLSELDADYYFCGPPSFMADLMTGLVARGVPEVQLHYESFGPVSTATP